MCLFTSLVVLLVENNNTFGLCKQRYWCSFALRAKVTKNNMWQVWSDALRRSPVIELMLTPGVSCLSDRQTACEELKGWELLQLKKIQLIILQKTKSLVPLISCCCICITSCLFHNKIPPVVWSFFFNQPDSQICFTHRKWHHMHMLCGCSVTPKQNFYLNTQTFFQSNLHETLDRYSHLCTVCLTSHLAAVMDR